MVLREDRAITTRKTKKINFPRCNVCACVVTLHTFKARLGRWDKQGTFSHFNETYFLSAMLVTSSAKTSV